jgi:mannosyltransferase
MCLVKPFNILLQLLSGWRMNVREYPVPKRDHSRATLFPLPREGWVLLALLAIMLLGAVLRFYGLGFQSLWGGELASWDFGGRDTVSRLVRDGTQPPLYFLILHFARWIFGDSEWALRLPSAVAGWLCIPAIYLLGKKLYSEREGIMAALFVAVLWAPVYYGQEARPYSVLIGLSILTSYFWWDLMVGLRYRGELPKREAAWYIVCAVLCSYTHYFGLLLVVLQAAALAALAFDGLRNVALLYVPVALAYLPWLPGMVNQFQNAEQAGYGRPTLQALPDYFQFLFGRSALLSLAAWTLLCFLLLRGWDDVRPRRKGAGVPPGLLLAAWAVGPFVVSYGVSQTSAGMLTNENLLVSLPAVYLLLARAVTRAFSGRAAGIFQGTVAAGLAAASLAYLIFSMDYYTTPTKEQVREAAAYVVAHEDKGTLVVRCDADDRLDYYLNAGNTGGKNSVQACAAEDVPDVEGMVKEENYNEVLHLISHPEPDQGMISMLQRNFQPVHYERFDGAAVVVYKVGQHPSAGPPQPEPPSSLPKQE